VRHEVRIRDEHARRVGMRAEHAHRFARLHEQRLVVAQVLERSENLVEAVPVARGPANAAVHHERMRMLGYFGVQIILDHAIRGFGEPALADAFAAARRANGAGGIETRIDVLRVVHDVGSLRFGSAQAGSFSSVSSVRRDAQARCGRCVAQAPLKSDR
jgi:hypothetical protein